MTTLQQSSCDKVGDIANATVAIGTSATDILSFPLPIGTWRIEGYVALVNVGAITNITFTLSPSGAPVCSALTYQICRGPASAAMTNAAYSAFNIASIGTVVPVHCWISGMARVTTAGILTVSSTRSSGTSSTVQIGSHIFAQKIA